MFDTVEMSGGSSGILGAALPQRDERWGWTGGSRLEATVRPGEFWLIEKTSVTELCSFDRGALSSADIVIYDRPLAAWVAQVLPIGGYAEPLSRNGTAGAAISPRALRFAAEGWRVAQLFETRHGD